MRHVVIASLLLIGCHSLAETIDEEFVLEEPPATVDFARSFIVTDHKTLEQLAPDFRIGALLVAENHYHDTVGELKKHGDVDFATAAFNVAADDVDRHNAYKGLKVGSVARIVNTFREVILPAYDPKSSEPFHLIAVVNRLDLAGDFDMRGGNVLAGAERRWFGEGRLVYAVDGTVDGKPYPMTFIMEYRLPALKRDANDAIVLDDAFDFAAGPTSEKDWRARRQLWAQVWQSLSSQPLGSDAYVKKLRQITSWFAYGTPFAQRASSKNARHHLAIRSGELVQDKATRLPTDELEYREYYLNGMTMFSTRKLRREPFACSKKSLTLARRLDSEWTGTDLAWNYMLGERNLLAPELEELTKVCGGQIPYGQTDDDEGDGDTATQFRAKFTRFQSTDVWPTGRIDTEAKVHAFAVGTCSGCHSGETRTAGFHIAPPVAGADAELSDFLTKKLAVTPRGARYVYDERTRRMDLVAHFAGGDTGFEDPLLDDIACHDLDVCTIN